MKLKDELKKMCACSEAMDWVEDRTLKQAWAECERADWLMWYVSNKIELKKLVRVSAMCAETILHIFEEKHPTDSRPRDCINACCKYAAGKITLEELNKHRYAAYAAANAANTATAADAATAAYAYAAANAANAATAAAYVADAAVTAAAYVAAAAAKKKQHKLMCDIIRREIKLKDIK